MGNLFSTSLERAVK